MPSQKGAKFDVEHLIFGFKAAGPTRQGHEAVPRSNGDIEEAGQQAQASRFQVELGRRHTGGPGPPPEVSGEAEARWCRIQQAG
jgi:hypothetical protein